jgi:hypothetical protein
VVSEADLAALNARIDRLYRLPRGDFTQARNDLAKELRSEGASDDAVRVKALKKPSVTAWGANQVVHHYPEAWAELLTATDRVRAAHADGAAELVPALERRKVALAAAVEAASGVLTRAGHRPGTPQLRKVANTLDALASGVTEETPGRVVQDLGALGFGALAGLAFASPATDGSSPGSKVRRGSRPRRTPRSPSSGKATGSPEERAGAGAHQKARARAEQARKRAADERRAKAKQAVARARDAVQRLEGELEAARRERTTAERQHDASVTALDTARATLEEARKIVADAQASAAGFGRRAKKLRDVEQRADAALADARATLDKAIAALEKADT